MAGIKLGGDDDNERSLTGWLKAIIESADDAIISKTLDGILTSWNKAAEHIFGYTSDEAIGQSVQMLIPDMLRDEESMIITKIKAGEKVEHYETKRRAKQITDVVFARRRRSRKTRNSRQHQSSPYRRLNHKHAPMRNPSRRKSEPRGSRGSSR